ncbi:amidase family protein [Tropicibacter sp. Alg240-R139]|uniref:amidase family protein n=1 Tax=Tropicibacter sp. Alg240-R139 TaxID=2305991 RepID=UPI0013DFFF47|nr:amidase family protein [Tropicibacter sp. Alg240-R139]
MPHLSAVEMTDLFRRRELSPVEALAATLARIEEVNPKINAIYHTDREGALVQAKASELRWRDGAPLGWLDGVPTTIKDALEANGMPTYRGSAAGSGVVHSSDHPTVARMRDTGAVIVGKNTMCDYGILASGVSSYHGVTRNPWNLSKSPGASSSGAAASVCAGIEPVSVGTDIVGSIRLPASYCGLAGHKPSYGRVPYYFQGSPVLVAGPLARSVTDVALHMNVLTGTDMRDFSALPRDGVDYVAELDRYDPACKRALVITELGIGEPVAVDVANATVRASEAMRGQGVQVDRLDTPPFERGEWEPAELFYMVRTLSELSRHPGAEQRKTPVIYDWTRRALDLTALDHHANFVATQFLRERTLKLIEGYDFLILPSAPDTAFDAELPGSDPTRIFESWANTFLFNLTEQPGSNVPMGLDRYGLPIGVQIIGQRYDDVGVLGLSHVLEQAVGRLKPPEL